MVWLFSRNLGRAFLALGAVAFGGCSDSNSSSLFALKFAPTINGVPFACGSTYSGIGTTRSTIQPTDLRFYVSNLRFVRADGSEETASLNNDGGWQYENIALLDFEDGRGLCTNGDAETNTEIRGEVADGEYTGVRFDIGIPLKFNHVDPDASPPPLNRTALWWNWNLGFRFFVFEFLSSGQPSGFPVHLGSTGCVGNESGGVNECQFPNRIAVDLAGYQESKSVVLELGSLTSTTNVDVNTTGTAPGCMSSQDDPQCRGLFGEMGLSFAGSVPDGQKFVYLAE